ncbi:MAG: type IV pilus assembly protein PilM [Elusimicrobia bacterium]|nr:type IV pilus assembly protein PilM [Elusimicrobiota bacterium]
MGRKEEIIQKIKSFAERAKTLAGPSKPMVAIDIGTFSLKLISMKLSGPSWVIEAAASREVPAQDLPMEGEERNSFIGREVRALFEATKIKNALVATNISGSSVIVREAKLPALPHEELEKSLSFEAEPFIPFDIKEVSLDYHIISDITEEGQRKYETILVAAKKDLIENRLGVLSIAGLSPAVVDVDAFALSNLMSLKPEILRETIIVCNIGETVTNLAILEKGTPRLVRDVAVAGSAFTRALHNAMGWEIAKVLQAKHEVGIILDEAEKAKLSSSSDGEEKLKISEICCGVASDLFGEISKSVDFYLTHGVERSINRIYLTGGGSLLKNLIPFAGSQMSMPVELFNPFSLLAPPAEAQASFEAGPLFSVACGLGMRVWMDWKKG